MECRQLEFLLLLLLLLCVGHATCSSQSDSALVMVEEEATVGHDDFGQPMTTPESAHPIFEPTCEWREVAEGQHIPGGLDVHMNMETGYKSAKLLDTKCENGVPIAAKEPQPDQTDQKKPAGAGSIPLNRPTMSLEAPPEGTKTRKPDPVFDEKWHRERLQRYYEKMSAELLKTDDPIMAMKGLIDVFNSNATDSEVVHALTLLEDYVQDLDNANDLHTIGGLVPVMHFIENSGTTLNRTYNGDVVATALWVLGTAQQSNPKVQKQAVELGAVRVLLAHLTEAKPNKKLRAKLLYALSTLLRDNPLAQHAFADGGGVATTMSLLRPAAAASFTDCTLVTKIVALFSDLANEERVAGRAELEHQLVAAGWCRTIASLLDSAASGQEAFDGSKATDDTVEKLLLAVPASGASCMASLAAEVKLALAKLAARFAVVEDEDIREYHEELSSLTQKTQTYLGL